MDDDNNRTYGIEKLAELLIERGIEFFVKDEVSLAYKDGAGSWHECWMAGADENRVNALIVVTPEQLLSVPDLNGIIDENDRLKAENKMLLESAESRACNVGMLTKTTMAENEKLKELCGDLMGWIAYTTMGESVPEETYCALEGRMSALRIEV